MGLLSNIVNVIDTESDPHHTPVPGLPCLLEIGLTTVDLKNRKIIQTYSIPIKPFDPNFQVSDEIYKLTGWIGSKLRKSGLPRIQVGDFLLRKYGFSNRLIVSDTDTEVEYLSKVLGRSFSPSRLNISTLFYLNTGLSNNLGLEGMLRHFKLPFEGRRHRANWDSKAIAQIFLKLLDLEECKRVKRNESLRIKFERNELKV